MSPYCIVHNVNDNIRLFRVFLLYDSDIKITRDDCNHQYFSKRDVALGKYVPRLEHNGPLYYFKSVIFVDSTGKIFEKKNLLATRNN